MVLVLLKIGPFMAILYFAKLPFQNSFIRFFNNARGVYFFTLLLFLEHFVVVLVLLVMHKKIERASIMMGKWLVHTRTLKSFNFQIEFMFLLPPQIIIKRKTFIRIHHHIYTLTRHTSNTIYLLSVIETIYICSILYTYQMYHFFSTA